MKKLLFAVLVFALCSAYVLPPALPSSFWGYAVGIPAGADVQVYDGSQVLAVAHVLNYGGVIAYQVDVTFGNEGDALQFKYNGALVGSGIYHTGTSQHVDIFRLVEGRIKRGK